MPDQVRKIAVRSHRAFRRMKYAKKNMLNETFMMGDFLVHRYHVNKSRFQSKNREFIFSL